MRCYKKKLILRIRAKGHRFCRWIESLLHGSIWMGGILEIQCQTSEVFENIRIKMIWNCCIFCCARWTILNFNGGTPFYVTPVNLPLMGSDLFGCRHARQPHSLWLFEHQINIVIDKLNKSVCLSLDVLVSNGEKKGKKKRKLLKHWNVVVWFCVPLFSLRCITFANSKYH